MDEPTPVWDGRPDRLSAGDLPRPCDMPGCTTTVGFDSGGSIVGGTVLADDARDYVFCGVHADQVIHANPFARPAAMTAGSQSG